MDFKETRAWFTLDSSKSASLTLSRARTRARAQSFSKGLTTSDQTLFKALMFI